MEKGRNYGNLQIDIPQFVENKRSVVTRGDSIMMENNIDSDFIDLLINPNGKKKKIFQFISRLFKETNQSFWIPNKINKQKVRYYKKGMHSTFKNSSDDLIDIFELIIGSIEVGNDNNNINEKVVAIIDELLKLVATSKDKHKILYNQNCI